MGDAGPFGDCAVVMVVKNTPDGIDFRAKSINDELELSTSPGVVTSAHLQHRWIMPVVIKHLQRQAFDSVS